MGQTEENKTRRIRRVPAQARPQDEFAGVDSDMHVAPLDDPVDEEGIAAKGERHLYRVPVEASLQTTSEPLASTQGGRTASARGAGAGRANPIREQDGEGFREQSDWTYDYDWVEEEVRPRQAPRRTQPWRIVLSGALIGVALGVAVVAVLLVLRANKSTAIQPPAQPTAISDAGNQAVSSKPTNVPTEASKPPTLDPKATPAGLFDLGALGVNKGQFNLPRGMTRDAGGNFFVADTGNFRIQKFDPTGKFLAMFGGKGDQAGQFNPMEEGATDTGPSGLTVDKAGNVYVADTWNHRIQKFDKEGKFLASWGGYLSLLEDSAAKDPNKDDKFWGPRGVAIGPDGNVYVTDTGNKRVLIFDPNGKFLRKIDSGMSPNRKGPEYPFDKPGELNEPIGIVVDGGGNIYVADANNHRIQKFDKDGKPVAQWPVPDNNWATGPYLEPFLALDAAGNVYATAPSGKNVLKFSPAGQLLGQKNKQGAYVLNTPTGITVDADGTIYVVDTNGNGVVNLGKIP